MMRPPFWWKERENAKRVAARRDSQSKNQKESWGKWIWAVLNTPFAISFLTVVVVGSIVWIYADFHTCMTQSDQDAERVVAVRKEIFARYVMIEHALGAKTAKEFKSSETIRNWNSFSASSQFHGLSMSDLLTQEDDLSSKTGSLSLLLIQLNDAAIQFDSKRPIVAGPNFFNFESVTDADLPELRKFLFGQASVVSDYFLKNAMMVPVKMCSVPQIVSRDLTGYPPWYVRFVKWQDYFAMIGQPVKHKTAPTNGGGSVKK